jgi:Replication initiation factor.
MFDKVKLWLPATRDTQYVGKYIERATDNISRETGEICTFGTLNGLKVQNRPNGCSICGSLPKFLYGNNLKSLDRHTIKEAIDKMETMLHCSIQVAKVTELELGCNFPMSKPVSAYLHKLGDCNFMVRSPLNKGSLYYINRDKRQKKVLCFYDKGAEMKAKNTNINGYDWLRYEMRFKGHLNRQLQSPIVEVSTLSDVIFYRYLIRRYQQEYFNIKKNNIMDTTIIKEIKTPAQAVEVLLAMLINQTDRGKIDSFLEELKANGVFTHRSDYTRLKQK